MPTIVLASASPRRAELLRAAGFAIEVVPAEVDEAPIPGEAPDAYVARVARDKASAVACRKPGSLILGADTAVVLDGEILGKPAGDEDARRMLERLSGRTHDVMTGVTLLLDGREFGAVQRTRVHFLPITADEIAWYIETGEPHDKAGAYAIQGLASRFVGRIEGSCSNVIGLPVATVYQLLREAGQLNAETGEAKPPGGASEQ
jgi:septum formation protein